MTYLFLADGFEEIEAFTTLDILRRAEIDVQTVACGQEQVVCGAHDILVAADMLMEELDLADISCAIFPGGPGVENLRENKMVGEVIRWAAGHGALICAICAAPSLLGSLLDGRRAVCYPGYESYLSGAEIAEGPVCCDGNFITGKGPGASADFAFAIAQRLAGADAAAKIRSAMCYDAK